jgi:hypothetical protein
MVRKKKLYAYGCVHHRILIQYAVIDNAVKRLEDFGAKY